MKPLSQPGVLPEALDNAQVELSNGDLGAETVCAEFSEEPSIPAPDPAESRATFLPIDVREAIRQRIEQAGVRQARSAPIESEGTLRPAARIKVLGDTLKGRFVLEDLVSRGAMSSVYKALDLRKREAGHLNPYVAVKVFTAHVRTRRDWLLALQREVTTVQRLVHPNIVTMYNFDRDGSTVYTTMEYLAGQSLSRRLAAPNFKRMSVDEALHIIHAVGKALSYAHECDIIHSNLTPDSIFLTESGEVKVTGFGMVSAFETDDGPATHVARCVNSPYACPQALDQRDPDPRDDVYALACIAYELLAGQHPFGEQSATLPQNGKWAPDPTQRLSRKQWRALKSALVFEREERTPEVAQLLRGIDPKPSLARPASIITGSAAALLVIAVGLGGYSKVAHDLGSALEGFELAALQPSALITNLSAAPNPMPVPAPDVGDTPEASLTSITHLLGQTPCSALDASASRGEVRLRGYASQQIHATGLEKALTSLPGVSRVTSDVRLVDRDKCGLLEFFAPYWATNQDAGLGTSIRARSAGGEIVGGAPLIVDISSPPYRSYINVDYYALDGSVIHMLPSPKVANNLAPANYQATLGDLGEWIVVEPFGAEMIVVLATPEPLFAEPRDEQEAASIYMSALRERLKQIARESGADKITAGFALVTSRPPS